MREITNELAPSPFRWTAEGLLAIQEVSVLFVGIDGNQKFRGNAVPLSSRLGFPWTAYFPRHAV